MKRLGEHGDTTPCDYPSCGRPATYVIDPFIAEIFEEEQWVWLCDECFQGRRDDI